LWAITLFVSAGLLAGCGPRPPAGAPAAELIVTNGHIATGSSDRPFVQALAISDGRVLAVGDDAAVSAHRGPATLLIDAGGRTVIPGLNDSHTHVIREGLNYTLELRWDGVPTLKEALARVKEQAGRTPPGQWVRVVGGWSPEQFVERRMPTLEEINAAAPRTPVFVLYLYTSALLNWAALEAVGYNRTTPDPPGGRIERDARGSPTGLLVARPSALLLYKTLSLGPKLAREEQLLSTRLFLRELNRFGVTSAIDAGGGGQNYPDDYSVIEEVARRGEMTVRVAYYLFAQTAGRELEDYQRWTGMTGPGREDAMLRAAGYLMAGAGENLTWAAADFENFMQPRPELAPGMEGTLRPIIEHLVRQRWPFRIHATYGESIGRFLDIFEAVNRDVPFAGLRWAIDHAETVTEPQLERIRALGGGVAIQHRMAFQGEHFLARYGSEAASAAPPIRRLIEMGIPVGAGTDATRVGTYNPWVALAWLVSGRTVGGTSLYPQANRLDRMEALRLFTRGSAWFSGEEPAKGTLELGMLADLAILSADYFSVPEEEIRVIESVLTIVGGRPVYGAGEFAQLAPDPPQALPAWSPVAVYGGYYSKP
jgi:hypothetical protein